MNGARRRTRPDTYLFFYVLFALVLFLTHAPLLDLPYYWDELGQFIPAALDIHREGAWIPRSATPNLHPPGVMAYLAGFWWLAGYSSEATRAAMLLVAAGGLLAAFLLAIELCRELAGTPAFVPVALLLVSPLFFSQALLAQLDMPAMLFTCLALLLFLQENLRASAAACVALVMVKETGAVVPLVLGAWVWREGRSREALWFAAPFAALAVWVAVLASATGHPFGDREFARYNLFYPLHPVRMAAALGRRLYFLLFEDFHWVGAIALGFAWKRRVFRSRPWRVALALVAAHVVLFSLVGGAVLERYLLPVLPLLYAAMAAAMWLYPRRARLASLGLMGAGLLAANLWNPPYPYPLENNLAFVDFVKLQATAAQFLERRYPGARVATTWPLAASLRRPELGYVEERFPVLRLPDFRRTTLERLRWNTLDVLVLYSAWDPPFNLMELGPLPAWRRRFFGYEPDVSREEAHRLAALRPVAGWSRRGLWIEVFVKREGVVPLANHARAAQRPVALLERQAAAVLRDGQPGRALPE